MKSLAVSSLALALAACTSSPSSATVAPADPAAAAAAPRPTPQRSVVAFHAVRAGATSAEPWVELAQKSIQLAAGDVLEYDIYVAGARADRAGVEIAFEDGSICVPPSFANADDRPVDPQAPSPGHEPESSASEPGAGGAPGGWVHRRVPLDRYAGATTVSFRLAARDADPGECVFYVENLVLQRPSSAPIALLDLSRGLAWRGSASDRGGGARAALFAVEYAPRYPQRGVPAGAVVQGEPWGLFDLTALRRSAGGSAAANNASRPSSAPEPAPGSGAASEADDRRAPSGRAIEVSLHPTPGEVDATGFVFLDAGTPFRFGAAGEARAITADGQRLSLGAVDGGRYYDLHLAVAIDGGEALSTSWEILGGRRSMRPLEIQFPRPARPQSAAEFLTLSVPIAAEFEIDSLRLPRDPRVRVLAASVRWRKDAPSDPEFRRRWIAREVPGEKIERYLLDLEVGAVFAELARSSVLDGESAHERKLFDLALRSDWEEFDRLLDSRLAAFASESSRFKRARITFVGCEPVAAGDGAAEATESTMQHLERAIDAEATVRAQWWDHPLAQARAWLKEHGRAAAEAPRATAAEKPSEASAGGPRGMGAQSRPGPDDALWAGGGTGGGPESMARELLFGRTFAHARATPATPATSANGTDAAAAAAAPASGVGVLPFDLAYARQFPQLCRSAGVDTLVGGATNGACDRPRAFAWKAPDGSVVSAGRWDMPAPRGATRLSLADLAERLLRAQRDEDESEILVSFDVDDRNAAGQQALGEDLATIDRLANCDLSPSVSITTPSSWLGSLHAASGDALPVLDGAREAARDCGPPETPSRVRAAARRAEAALSRAERYATLARADGALASRTELTDLWMRLLRCGSVGSADAGAVAAAEEGAREIAARAEEIAREELAALARSIDTRGSGQPIVVFNPLPWPRVAPIEVAELDVAVIDAEARPVESQATWNGGRVFLAALPSLGYAVFHLVPAAASPKPTPAPPSDVRAPTVEAPIASAEVPAAPYDVPTAPYDVPTAPNGVATATYDVPTAPKDAPAAANGAHTTANAARGGPNDARATPEDARAKASEARAPAGAARSAKVTDDLTIANERLSVTFDPKTGRVRSLKALPVGEELLVRTGMGGNAILSLPRSDGSAGSTAPEFVDDLDSIRVLERGPVRSLVRIERTVEASRLVQDLALYANTFELSIRSRVEGPRGTKRLSAGFEVKNLSPWVVYGVPFGSVTLPCVKLDAAREIRALDWISQGTPQLSLTLCSPAGTAFGASVRGIAVTLDDPDVGADRTPREVECALRVRRGSWRMGAMHAAAELEHPPQVVRAQAHEGTRPPTHSFLRLGRLAPGGQDVDGLRSGVLMSALKVAEEGDDWIVRVYETLGQAGTVRLTFDRPLLAAHKADVLERPSAALGVEANRVEIPIKPYRVETLRVSFPAQ